MFQFTIVFTIVLTESHQFVTISDAEQKCALHQEKAVLPQLGRCPVVCHSSTVRRPQAILKCSGKCQTQDFKNSVLFEGVIKRAPT